MTQKNGHHNHGCKKYPGDKKQEALSRATEAAKEMVADPVRFMKMVIDQRSAPPTEVVAKNQKHHRFCFGYPLVIKPLDGRPLVLANDAEEAEAVTRQFKSVGYQVQKHLRGYTFIKVAIQDGVIDSEQPKYITGAVRRLVTLLLVQGVKNFTLTVATNKVTTYIIGAKLN